MEANFAQWLETRAQQRQALGGHRSLVPTPADVRLDVSHNDYLALRDRTDFQEACRSVVAELPVGSGASRLLGGEHPFFGLFEQRFADWKQAESCLYFSSGFAANEALCSTLADAQVHFFSDALNHASIVDGLRFARQRGAALSVFQHNDLEDLRAKLQEVTAPVKLIVVESLYSMDGDKAPLVALFDVAERFNATLIIDEAHATGLYGPEGKGLVAAAGLSHKPHIAVTTFGKALAVQGAAVTAPLAVRNELINAARPFIYSTGPSPWIVAACDRALTLVSAMDQERRHLAQLSAWFRERCRSAGLDIGPTDSHIIPVMAPGNERALRLASFLREAGVLAKAIRAPTVAKGSERVRLSLHAGVTQEWAECLLNLLLRWQRQS